VQAYVEIVSRGSVMALPMDPTCCLCHSVRYAASAWGDSLNGSFKRQPSQYILNQRWDWWLPTAVDEVIMKTPPSGFALNVGSASLKRYQLLLTFVVQHWVKLSAVVVHKSGLLTLSQSSSSMASRSLNVVILVQPLTTISPRQYSEKHPPIELTAFEITISRPPSCSIVVLIALLQS
jgi:hypothetical protein